MDFESMAARAAAGVLAVGAGLALGAPAGAAIISVDLGQSAEDFILYGMGDYAPGLGSFTVGQGAGVFDAGSDTSTFTLSGAINGGTTGWNSGTYEFITSYTGPTTPDGGPNAPQAHSSPSNPNSFFYSFLDPSVTMTLDLFGTPTGDHSVVLFTGGVFQGGFGFGFTSASCTGVAVCGQNIVGETPGATISGPVTMGASFEVPDAVPEPGAWALMIAGFGAAGAALRARRRAVAV